MLFNAIMFSLYITMSIISLKLKLYTLIRSGPSPAYIIPRPV